MARKIILAFLIVSLLAGASYLVYLRLNETPEKEEIVDEKVRHLPSPRLVTMDSASFSMPRDGNIILIFFNPECIHCQYEATLIRDKVSRFENENMIFISSEPLSSIRDFAKLSDLDHYPNIHFTKIDIENVFDTFGKLSIPHIFIYDGDKKLVKQFRGETNVEDILNYIP